MIYIRFVPKYKPPKAKIVKEKKFVQFSKRCLAAMILLWFIGAVFAFAVVACQVIRGDMSVALSDLLLYIGAPMTGGIVSYMIKSAWEKQGEKTNEHRTDY